MLLVLKGNYLVHNTCINNQSIKPFESEHQSNTITWLGTSITRRQVFSVHFSLPIMSQKQQLKDEFMIVGGWNLHNPFAKIYLSKTENEVPILIKASTSLILRFTPVIPTMISDTCIHPCVCKNYSPKRSPRSSKICIWCPSIASYNTPATIPEKVITGNQRRKSFHMINEG